MDTQGKLNPQQLDTLGEIGNITMGNSATTLSMMVNKRVDITTPQIQVVPRAKAMEGFEKTCIFVNIKYVKGITGNNVFILRPIDVLVLTDLMMGGAGQPQAGPLSELHISAASEAMNQMMGASATSMSTMLKLPVDISTPNVSQVDVDSVIAFEQAFEAKYQEFVRINFHMEIEGVLASSMIQMYPLQFAVAMCNQFNRVKGPAGPA